MHYLSVADNAVQIKQNVFVDKETQPELGHKTRVIALLTRISDLLYLPVTFWFKFSK